MSHFSGTATNSADDLGLLHGMGFNCVSMPSQRHPKEVGHPSVDFFAPSSGIYIPPEETQPDAPIEDLSGWGFSDDDQNDSDDEEMDDNEYDLDFAEVDLSPPMGSSDDIQSGVDFSSYARAPSEDGLQYVDPMQLYNNDLYANDDTRKIFNDNSNPDAVNVQAPPPVEYPEINNVSNTNPPHIQDPKQLDICLDYDMDLDMDDIYAPIVNELERGQEPQESQEPESKQAPSQPQTVQPQALQSPPAVASAKVEPMELPFDDYTNDDAFAQDLPQHDLPQQEPQQDLSQDLSQDYLPEFAEEKHIMSPPASPPLEKPRRKTAPRRRTPRATHQPTHGGAHVCTMKYPDGSGCNRSFTRPYDLARHQETLHAAVRKMYKCEACGSDSKTFSRLDALSRHMRLKHN